MKILLLGHGGQVGWELQRALAPLGEVIAPGRRNADGLCGDLEHPDELSETVRMIQPQVIVNAAAYTDVDRAESEPEQAERINAETPGALARAAAKHEAWLLHYSTDYVFDGNGRAPWRETDDPAPLNVYGASKWRGEQAIREAAGPHLIFRTQWVYAARGKNFLRTMLRLASERDCLKVIDDQSGAPTGAELIADVTAHALREALRRPNLSGTYHLAARGEVTWYGYARYLLGVAREFGWPVRVNDEAIEPVGTQDFPSAARRPFNSRLAVGKIESAFGLSLPDWRQGVRRSVMELIAQNQSRETI